MNLFTKLALNKAQKLINAGLLSGEARDRIYNEYSTPNNLNTRINAKNKRMLDNPNAFRKIRDKVERYKKISDIDALPQHNAAINTRRFMKYHGRENAQNVAAARRGATLSFATSPDNKLYSGSSGYRTQPGVPDHFTITLPGQRANRGFEGADKKLRKEIRSAVANHEMSGELPSQRRRIKYLRNNKEGISLNQRNMEAYGISTHDNPSILARDGRIAQQYSEKYKNVVDQKFRNNPVGRGADENQISNMFLGNDPNKKRFYEGTNLKGKEKSFLNQWGANDPGGANLRTAITTDDLGPLKTTKKKPKDGSFRGRIFSKGGGPAKKAILPGRKPNWGKVGLGVGAGGLTAAGLIALHRNKKKKEMQKAATISLYQNR